MFECMEIAEYIYEDVVETYYKTTARAYDNHSGCRRNRQIIKNQPKDEPFWQAQYKVCITLDFRVTINLFDSCIKINRIMKSP